MESPKKKTVKRIPTSDKASRLGNADRRSRERKGSNGSLSEAKSTVLESRNKKRRKSSSTLKRSVQTPKDQVQQPSKDEVPEKLNDLNLTMQSVMKRKTGKQEGQDVHLSGRSSEQDCSALKKDPHTDTESANKQEFLDGIEKPTLKDFTSAAQGRRKKKQKHCRKVSGVNKI